MDGTDEAIRSPVHVVKAEIPRRGWGCPGQMELSGLRDRRDIVYGQISMN